MLRFKLSLLSPKLIQERPGGSGVLYVPDTAGDENRESRDLYSPEKAKEHGRQCSLGAVGLRAPNNSKSFPPSPHALLSWREASPPRAHR